MLLLKNTRGQGVCIIVALHRHSRLNDDWARIHIPAHVVDGAARKAHPGIYSPLLYVQPLERGQQGRVDVDHAVSPMVDKFVT